MQLNLGMILRESADSRPDHIAIRLGERTLDYAEVDRKRMIEAAYKLG